MGSSDQSLRFGPAGRFELQARERRLSVERRCAAALPPARLATRARAGPAAGRRRAGSIEAPACPRPGRAVRPALAHAPFRRHARRCGEARHRARCGQRRRGDGLGGARGPDRLRADHRRHLAPCDEPLHARRPHGAGRQLHHAGDAGRFGGASHACRARDRARVDQSAQAARVRRGRPRVGAGPPHRRGRARSLAAVSGACAADMP